jgi:SAM-dependent methyltransferase
MNSPTLPTFQDAAADPQKQAALDVAVLSVPELRVPDLSVPVERWRQAQRWEGELWKNANRPLRNAAKRVLQRCGLRSREVGDDWNHWWAERLDWYKFVPARIENAVEFGCGPYTNLRLISKGRIIDHAYCSDPLLRSYLKFRYTWLSDSYRRHKVLVDDHAMEECPFASDFFDLVVIINVLDHVRDAAECLRQAVRVTRPGGLLIVGQDLTSAEDLSLPQVRSDIGHPIRVVHQTLDSFLQPAFNPTLYQILPRDQGREPAAHYGTYLFAGCKG